MNTSPAVPCVSVYGWEGPSVSARSVGSLSRVLVLGVMLGSWLPVDFPERQIYSSTACEECEQIRGGTSHALFAPAEALAVWRVG